MKITVIGSTNIDLTLHVDHFPLPGETIASRSFGQANGGKGANQAVTCARLGADVTFVTALGADSYAPALLSDFAADGIDTSRIVMRTSVNTGLAFILIDSTGENNITIAAGANATVSPEDIENCRAAIEDADVLVM
ncbi:MAG: ribokinase, partial [Muribaculaceae bacterium]|nr:ribokinase [Muribaculaceae bacterium]